MPTPVDGSSATQERSADVTSPVDSFLNYMDLSPQAISPDGGGRAEKHTVESFLVQRARFQTSWSEGAVPRLEVVRDQRRDQPGALVDGRLIGWVRMVSPSSFAREATAGPSEPNNVVEPSWRLALLPPGTDFGDFVAYFPGAEVPRLYSLESAGSVDFAMRSKRRTILQPFSK